MKKGCTILISLLMSTGFCFSQQHIQEENQRLDRSYREFRSFFESTLRNDPGDTLREAGLFHFIHPEQLPLWVFMPLNENADSIYILGVSVPGMDEESGLEMALQHALIINGLAGVVDVANMREQYSIERNNEIQNIYSDYSEFSCFSNVGIDDLQIVEKHRTQYDETIVLVRIEKNKEEPSAYSGPARQIHISLYTRATAIDNRMQIDEQLNIQMPRHFANEEKTYSHQYSIINRIVNTRTKLNDEIISDLPALNLRYADRRAQSDNMKVNDINSNEQGLNNGLWHAMLAAMLSSIADEAHTGSIHFSQVSDMYDRLMVSLSSELVRTRIKSSLPALYVNDNRLFVSISPEVLTSD